MAEKETQKPAPASRKAQRTAPDAAASWQSPGSRSGNRDTVRRLAQLHTRTGNYDQWEADARESAAALAGYSPGGMASRLGVEFSAVRIHTQSREAAALGADAVTSGQDIYFAPGRYRTGTPEGRKLLAHELTHVAQQASGASVKVQFQDAESESEICTQDLDFIEPKECPATPESFTEEVEIEGPAGVTGEKEVRKFLLPEPVTGKTPILLYAIPAHLTGDTAECREDEDETFAVPPRPNPGRVVVDGAALAVEKVVGGYYIVSQYHQFAVGAGAVTIVETDAGVRLFDAGVGNEGGTALADAAMDKIRAIVGNRPILEIVISHLHEDHTSLMPRIAREFAVGGIRVSAVQYADPRFKQLLNEFAAEQEARVRQSAAADFEARRAAWEADRGAEIADAALREQAFQQAKGDHVSKAVSELRAKPTTLDLLVPNGGRLEMASAPIGTVLPPDHPGTSDPVSEGLRRAGVPGDISDTSLTDPKAGEKAVALEKKKAADPAARLDDTVVDQTSTSYIIDLPNKNRLIYAPDIRTDDLTRKVKPDDGSVPRSNFEAELAKLGNPATFQVWSITHHMQSGWVPGSGTVVNTSQLIAFTELMANVHRMQTAQAPEGGRGPANMVSVSVQGDPTNAVTRSLVNPAMVWFLRSLGFEVFLATSGRDLRLLEAMTPGGRKVEGMAGLPYEGLGPSDPLLLQSEIAIRHLKAKLTLEEARKAPPNMKTADKAALVADRTANIKRLKDAIKALEATREGYIQAVSAETWRGAHEQSKPAVAPDPAQPMPVSITQAEGALRAAMKSPDLADFVPPAAPEAAVVADTALVLMRQEPGSTLTTEGKALLESNQRADELRSRIQNGEGDATTKAALMAELATLRGLIESQLKTAAGGTRSVLHEELIYTQREIESLGKSPEGTLHFTREPGTGRLIENKVVRVPAQAPTAADKIRSVNEMASRPLGALMVIQTVKSETGLLEQVEAGQASVGQGIVGTVHNAGGITIGVRMMTGMHVSAAEFVVMSVLDLTQTAIGSHDTTEEAAVAISQSAVRGALNVFTLVLSNAMVRSGNPYVVAAGVVIGFVTEPIMAFLDYVGLFDAIERTFAFLPSEVTEANQDLRDLMEEYRGIIGALELASRPDEELQSLGVADPAALRTTAGKDVETYRAEAAEKEAELLETFGEAYTRAKDDYAGLFELDTLRSQFLSLRSRAHKGNTGTGDASRTAALDTFARIDEGLSLDHYTSEEIADMPVWEELEDQLDSLADELDEDDISDIDWDDVKEDQSNIEQILRTARYRLNPGAFGMRKKPLLDPEGSAGKAYIVHLRKYEEWAARLRRDMVTRLSGGNLLVNENDPFVGLATAEAFLEAYKSMLDRAPARPFTPEQLYSHSMDMGPIYRRYLRDNEGYSIYLDQLKSAETAMLASYQAVVESNAISPADRVQTLKDRIDSAISLRTGKYALLYKEELDARVAKIHGQEVKQLAPALYDDTDIRPLSEEEEYAIREGDLDEYEDKLGTTVDWLEKVPGIRIPDSPDERIEGIHRVVGDIGEMDFILFGVPSDNPVSAQENVIVGIAGEGHDVTTGRGHDVSLPVVPLNAPAFNRLGAGQHYLLVRYLQPVLKRELLNEVAVAN